MIEKIHLALVGESGEIVPIKQTNERLEIKIEVATADLYTAICFHNNSIEDVEIRTAEKFHFAAILANHLQEVKENASK